MQDYADELMKKFNAQPLHIKPSDDNEVQNYFRIHGEDK